MRNAYQEADVERVVKEVVDPWKEARPAEELWDLVSHLMTYTILEHPEIILLTNDQARELLIQHEIVLPIGVRIGDLAGKANPGIVQARSKLNRFGK